jgi:hypothetical protein
MPDEKKKRIFLLENRKRVLLDGNINARQEKDILKVINLPGIFRRRMNHFFCWKKRKRIEPLKRKICGGSIYNREE